MYGPTETVCGITMENPVLSSPSTRTPLGFSVGRESSIYIILPNSNMTLAPIGCIGEIYISGPTVGMGYFGDEEKTRECFLNDPFRGVFRMYKTSDLGWYVMDWFYLFSFSETDRLIRVNHEGRLFFSGRLDDQLNYRGYRVEIGKYLIYNNLNK